MADWWQGMAGRGTEEAGPHVNWSSPTCCCAQPTHLPETADGRSALQDLWTFFSQWRGNNLRQVLRLPVHTLPYPPRPKVTGFP